MKSIIAIIMLLTACRNEAITFAHMLNPQASCNAIHTGIDSGKYDTAICRVGGAVFTCEAFSLECKQIAGPAPAERPPAK